MIHLMIEGTGDLLNPKGSERNKERNSEESTRKLRESIDDMEEGSKTLSKLKRFAKELSRSLEEPVGSMNVLGDMKPMGLAPAFIISSKDEGGGRSAARTLMDYYRMVQEGKNEKRTLEDITGRSNSEIRTDLQEAIDAELESEFNFLGYRFLYELECFLRDIIQERIIDANQDNMGNYVPKNILQQCHQRKETEESSVYTRGAYRWIDYADFNDLKTILERGKNRRHFQNILNEEQFKCVVSKLHELDPIRKKIAHSRSLTKEEFDRLSMYSEDIGRLLGESN